MREEKKLSYYLIINWMQLKGWYDVQWNVLIVCKLHKLLEWESQFYEEIGKSWNCVNDANSSLSHSPWEIFNLMMKFRMQLRCSNFFSQLLLLMRWSTAVGCEHVCVLLVFIHSTFKLSIRILHHISFQLIRQVQNSFLGMNWSQFPYLFSSFFVFCFVALCLFFTT